MVAERTLPEQFAGLPDQLQGRLFRLLDLVAGMSHEEKVTACGLLSALARADRLAKRQAPELLTALASFIGGVDQLATGSQVCCLGGLCRPFTHSHRTGEPS